MAPLAVDIKVAKKIGQLLALSNSTNEFEAQVALDKAQEFLTRYNLTAADIAGINLELDEVGIGGVIHKEYSVDIGSRQSFEWVFDLARHIASSSYCKVLFYLKQRKLVFIGRETDVDACIEMFKWLYVELFKMAQEESQNQKDVHATRYRNSFLSGAVERIGVRLKQNRIERESKNCKVTALARCSDKENDAYVAETWKKVSNRNLGGGRRSYAAAYNKGFESVSNVALSRPNTGIKAEPMGQLVAG